VAWVTPSFSASSVWVRPRACRAAFTSIRCCICACV
jgi:hypothetical protein